MAFYSTPYLASAHTGAIVTENVGRLAGHMYSRTHDLFEMKRPNPDYKG